MGSATADYRDQTGWPNELSIRLPCEAENHEAFVAHFTREVGQYGRVAIINLVDQVGKEKSLSDAFLHHIVSYNDENLVYIAFDFHEYCRGMRFENVSILVDVIKDVIKDIRYCWVDKKGLICAQTGVFRVNCVDCLDRTNVVQSAIARVMLETQCRKLGLLPPDEELPVKFRFLYQQMWANNGDAISRQYAGTAALKGDFTRTGERKFSGLMKDGVNSANRYYRNQFKDIYRQATIDLMLGVTSSAELQMVVTNRGGTGTSGGRAEDEEDFVLVEKEENMTTLIDEWKKMLILEPEACLGSWGLIDCDSVTGDPMQQDMDIILLLSQRAYYIANYDDEIDTVTSYQKIFLEQLDKIEIGPEPSVFKSRHVCIRIWYRHDGEPGYFHMFRTTNTRLFNNIVIAIKNEEEARESLRAVCESFNAAIKLMDLDLLIIDNKLDRKRSKPAPNVINVASQQQTSTWSRWSPLSRDASNLSMGSLSPFDYIKPPPVLNIAELGRTFAELNPIRKVTFGRLRAPRMPGFMPAVWYRKNAESSSGKEDRESLECDRICSSREVFPDEENSGKLMTLERDYNLEDLDAVLSHPSLLDAEIEVSDSNSDIILNSCGILASSSSQVLSSIINDCNRTESLEALYLMRRAQRASAELASSSSSHMHSAIEANTDTGRQSNSSVLSDTTSDIQLRLKHGELEKKAKRHHSSADLYEKRRVGFGAPLGEVLHDGKKLAEKASVSSNPTQMSNEDFTSSCQAPSPYSQPQDLSSEVSANYSNTSLQYADRVEENGAPITKQSSSQIMDTMPGLTHNEAIKSFITRTDDDSSSAELSSLEEPMRPRHPKIQMIHPSMKQSFSETSLSTTLFDMDHLDLDLKPSINSSFTTPFSKLRTKMSNLTIPSLQSSQAKRSAAQNVALENKYMSELRFKECKTRILLL